MYSRIRSQIDELVKTDPTAFYSYEEYDTAAQMLYDTVKLRAKSIAGQLDGSIPSTDDGQRADSSALIDASDIDVEVMGQFSMGGFGGQRSDAFSESVFEKTDASMPDARSDAGTPPDTPSASDQAAQDESTSDSAVSAGVHRQRPSFSDVPGQSSGQAKSRNLIIFGACFAVMLIALILAKLYKRNRV